MTHGIVVKSPEGRLFRVDLLMSGCDNQGRPAVCLKRLDRQERELRVITRPMAEVEGWEVVR